jgi:hypothetical protein
MLQFHVRDVIPFQTGMRALQHPFGKIDAVYNAFMSDSAGQLHQTPATSAAYA